MKGARNNDRHNICAGDTYAQYKTHDMQELLQPLTSQMAFNAVSVPRVKSVPGTLLLIVAGTIVIGMQNSGCLSLASAIIKILWKACTSNSSTCRDNSPCTADQITGSCHIENHTCHILHKASQLITRSSAIAKSTARPSCLGGVLSHIYWERIC